MVLNVFINLDTNLLILDPGHCICWTHTTGQNAPRRRKMKILRYYTFSLWFIDKRLEWQSYHCGMEMIFKTNLIALGLDWSWNEIWKSPNSWWLAFQHVTDTSSFDGIISRSLSPNLYWSIHVHLSAFYLWHIITLA